jgi:hypothetical protein
MGCMPYCARIHHQLFITIFVQKYSLEKPPGRPEFITVTQPDDLDLHRAQPQRLVSHGLFEFWAKRRLPPDVASVAGNQRNPKGAGGCKLVVPDGASAVPHAVNLAGLEARDGVLRRWLLMFRN